MVRLELTTLCFENNSLLFFTYLIGKYFISRTLYQLTLHYYYFSINIAKVYILFRLAMR